ncbi:MAG: phenylacetate--CoA ligase family protein [Eubacteriales bacterium]|jgi:phenylacetate-CoA ligase
MYFQKEIETMKRSELEELQLRKLKWTVQYCYDNVPMYRKKFDAAGVTADKIKSLKDIQYLPYTYKSDFKENYPFGMFAVPRKEIVRVHGSSGTTGKPTIVGYTRADMDMWSDLIARIVTMAGVGPDDVAQIAFGYGLFTGGFGLHQGLEKVGAMVIPLSSGNTERQLMIMQDMGTTALIATPSYAIYLSEMIRERGIKTNLRVGLFGGEGCTAAMREQIEKNMGIIVTDNWGMSELIGPGVSGECIYRDGLHLAEDHFLPEIINPETEEVLAPGETGEIVVTSLDKQAIPVIRYRTRDITRLNYEPCKCGRTHVRMDKIKGRSDDMIVFKGVNVFPSQIEAAIMGVDQVAPHYMIHLTTEGVVDNMEVQLELNNSDLLESYGELKKLEQQVTDRLHSTLGLRAKVRLVEPNSLPRFEGKAKRIIDDRKL